MEDMSSPLKSVKGPFGEISVLPDFKYFLNDIFFDFCFFLAKGDILSELFSSDS
jgi:hypothetical protein